MYFFFLLLLFLVFCRDIESSLEMIYIKEEYDLYKRRFIYNVEDINVFNVKVFC